LLEEHDEQNKPDEFLCSGFVIEYWKNMMNFFNLLKCVLL